MRCATDRPAKPSVCSTNPSRWLKPSRSDQFCHDSAWPSSVNETPDGWVISIGSRSSRTRRSGTKRGTYSPITPGGFETENVSSISSSSIEFRSTMQCSPLTGFA